MMSNATESNKILYALFVYVTHIVRPRNRIHVSLSFNEKFEKNT